MTWKQSLQMGWKGLLMTPVGNQRKNLNTKWQLSGPAGKLLSLCLQQVLDYGCRLRHPHRSEAQRGSSLYRLNSREARLQGRPSVLVVAQLHSACCFNWIILESTISVSLLSPKLSSKYSSLRSCSCQTSRRAWLALRDRRVRPLCAIPYCPRA